MKKRIVFSLIISLLIMVALPLITIFLLGSDDILGILFLLLLILNPIASIVIGIISGGQKVLWYLPVINSALYLLSYGIMVAVDVTLIISAAVYIALGLAAAYITKVIKSKKS